ncbi:MAG: lytic murein transglycosylase [Solirubrobacterales bacterium]
MRRKLPLTIGLAVLGVSVTAGTATSEPLVGVGESGVEINLPDGQNLQELELLPQCANLVDDDGDGLKDLADPDCSNPLDTTESGSAGNPPPPEPPAADPGGGNTGAPPTGGGTGGGTTGNATGGGGFTGPTGSGGQGGGSAGDGDEVSDNRKPMEEQPERRADGTPTGANPSLTIADYGAAPIGVPNFVIDQFTIPPFLLPIYQACGTQYGVPWQILASINRIETAFGTNLNVSSAGALGWMQFIPSSWKAYGVDANDDGRKDPYNPVDAICAAGRYLKAAGYANDPRGAIFAYNHADWYVDEVLLYANQYGKLPTDLISSLTGLTEGARFPVAANARYADDISERRALRRSKPGKGVIGNAADVISSSPTRRGINIYSREGAPVVAVNDGVITDVGESKELGKYIVLRDAYGNRFTYAQLGRVSDVFPVPKRANLSAADFRLVSPRDEQEPDQPASAGGRKSPAKAESESGIANTEDARERLYAYPERPRNVGRADLTGQIDELLSERFPGYDSFKAYFSGVLRFDQKSMQVEPLKEGSKVIAGTVLGRIGKTDQLAPHLHFAIRPAGRGAPRIDPKPILDGWKLLEATAIYRAAGENPFTDSASTGQVLLMSKPQLVERALSDPRLEIYSCGRQDIQTGQIDRRVLAMLEYLVSRGFRLTVTSLKCGHSVYTSSGNVSHHSSGNAVDIAQINGLPVLGNQGPGSITEALVRDVMQLQGSMAPSQIISLMDLGANTYAMGDHADHVHVGYTPLYGPGSASVSKQFSQILKADQWSRLIDRIGEIDNPAVPTSPSRYAVPTRKAHDEGSKRADRRRASSAHLGE